jgi:hypothetical protein
LLLLTVFSWGKYSLPRHPAVFLRSNLGKNQKDDNKFFQYFLTAKVLVKSNLQARLAGRRLIPRLGVQ